MKQSKLRKRRVIRFSILFYIMLILFVALIAGPLVAGKYVPKLSIPLDLAQPTGLNHNDTLTTVTGQGLNGLGAKGAATASASS